MKHYINYAALIRTLCINGRYAIYFRGQGDASNYILEERNVIANNIFLDQTSSAIGIQIQKECKINNNLIYTTKTDTNLTNNGYGGIGCWGNGLCQIDYNRIFVKVDGLKGGASGISFQTWGTINSLAATIKNNLVNTISYNSGSTTGFGMLGINHVDILNNTVKVEGNSGIMYAVWLSNANSNRIFNNVFSNFCANDSSVSIYLIGDPAIYLNTMNYNCLYSASPNIAFRINPTPPTYFGTLSDWQQQTGYDLSSIFANPLFSDSLLHVPLYSPVCSRGTPLPEVTDDIEGSLRKNPPTIGAYEIDSCEVSVAEIPETPDGLFSLFPNPAQNEVSIFMNTKDEKIELEIFSIDGKKLLNKNLLNSSVPYFFDVSKWGSGIYYCRVKDGNNYSMKRFAVVK